ncbi:hypothetical protein QKW35_13510 [Pontibacterium granulatum]|uniref:hypothetical protein n=1 Tax=Pontibacterium granulatum TaxID=2036029 RepID=UPI00249BF40B|nr:hypothetical protein [Pontibacterium granulatum]MDI3325394.1 hypothetical protein [Pontibacterium granulatum]
MIYIIFPVDPSTSFLSSAIDVIKEGIGDISINVITIEASDEAYRRAKAEVQEIPDGAFVLFMGHGTSKSLYGGCSKDFKRKDFLVTNDLHFFKGKDLFLLSCHSSSLLYSSRKQRNHSNALGFGALPSDMDEANSNNKLASLGLSNEDIAAYREFLATCIPSAIVHYFQNGYKFEFIEQYLIYLLNKEINRLVLEDKNRPLAGLIFSMRTEINSM